MAAYGKVKSKSHTDVTPEGGKYEATVTVIDSVFDSASGTFGVGMVLPNAACRLPAGIRCQVDFPAVRSLVSRSAEFK